MRYPFIIVLIFLGCQNPLPSKYKTFYEKTKAKKYALKVVKYSNTYKTILKPFYDINKIFFNLSFNYKKAEFQRR